MTKYDAYELKAQQAMPPYTTALNTGLRVRISNPSVHNIAIHGVMPRAYVALAVLRIGTER
jgi:hypothetical protein